DRPYGTPNATCLAVLAKDPNGVRRRVQSRLASNACLERARTSTPASATASFAVEVVVTRLDVGPEAVCASAALLSDAERQRAGRFAFDRDRCRFVVARARLRQLLGARLNVRPDSVELVYGAHGKPALGRFTDSDLRFNLSHSAETAVYVFALGREVGIDVEAIRAIPDADEIAARLFSRRENKAYLALDPRDKPLGFFNCWTRKEAFIKALGDGLRHPLDRFDVSLAPTEPAKILRVGSARGDRCGWSMESFSPAPGLVAAVVVESGRRRTRAADPAPRSAQPAKSA
ncbi:MAG TPA: 4'-phosphopantetheinyl transferase superfamily protein, partial [Steroidobacteraceae bacterium]|nr:4'-phosphopantetheinyl transferase superfamily protein [Steroidobacteraceae bacterium]